MTNIVDGYVVNSQRVVKGRLLDETGKYLVAKIKVNK